MNDSSDDIEILAGLPAGVTADQVPAWAAARGRGTVCVLDGVHADGRRMHWLHSALARGWIEVGEGRASLAHAGPGFRREDGKARHSRESGNPSAPFHAAFTTARARGFVPADAALLAAMALDGAAALPRLSWGEAPVFADAAQAEVHPPLGLYAIVDSADRLPAILGAGVRTVQLRIKCPAEPDAAWSDRLRAGIARSVALARDAGAMLFVNDHWREAAELGAPAVHLGQEDLLALGEIGRAQLRATGMALGVSSHSLWELARARALAPRYIACGPVWATTTKDMPWHPQGLDNLAWWCRMAAAPVVAIGGILAPWQVRDAAACGADGVCLVRGLGEQPQAVLPSFRQAYDAGRAAAAAGWPHPSLPD